MRLKKEYEIELLAPNNGMNTDVKGARGKLGAVLHVSWPRPFHAGYAYR
jgi:hypothetical protein